MLHNTLNYIIIIYNITITQAKAQCKKMTNKCTGVLMFTQ